MWAARLRLGGPGRRAGPGLAGLRAPPRPPRPLCAVCGSWQVSLWLWWVLGGQVVSIVLLRLRMLPLLWRASASPSVIRHHEEHTPALCGATSTHPVVRLPPTFGRLPALCAWPSRFKTRKRALGLLPGWPRRPRAETQILCPFPECPHPLLCPGRRMTLEPLRLSGLTIPRRFQKLL